MLALTDDLPHDQPSHLRLQLKMRVTTCVQLPVQDVEGLEAPRAAAKQRQPHESDEVPTFGGGQRSCRRVAL